MFPVGSYEHFVQEIKNRENPDVPVTFGLLIADCRQQAGKQYILNYLERFHHLSGEYINFYLPGYLNDSFFSSNDKITVNNKDYYFDFEFYNSFLEQLEKDFNIKYPYSPVLYLIEYSKGNFKFSKSIRFDLDTDTIDIRKVGELFEVIFKIAHANVDIEEFKKEIWIKLLKKNLIDDIVTLIDNKYLSFIVKKSQELNSYHFCKAN